MKSRLVFFICFFITFGAGLTVGMLWATPAPRPSRDPFMGELDLSTEQREKIKSFWTEAMKNGWQIQREQRESAQKERDESVRNMLSAEQRARQEEILRNYQAKIDAINLASKRARDEAYEKTKSVLTPQQLVKYEEMRKKRFEGRGRSDHGPGPGPGPGGPPLGPPPFQFEGGSKDKPEPRPQGKSEL